MNARTLLPTNAATKEEPARTPSEDTPASVQLDISHLRTENLARMRMNVRQDVTTATWNVSTQRAASSVCVLWDSRKLVSNVKVRIKNAILHFRDRPFIIPGARAERMWLGYEKVLVIFDGARKIFATIVWGAK